MPLVDRVKEFSFICNSGSRRDVERAWSLGEEKEEEEKGRK